MKALADMPNRYTRTSTSKHSLGSKFYLYFNFEDERPTC
jgi:hypothetical protein